MLRAGITRVLRQPKGNMLLLGVGGVVVIGHGRSDGRAVANALGLAARALDRDVNGEIVRGLEAGA